MYTSLIKLTVLTPFSENIPIRVFSNRETKQFLASGIFQELPKVKMDDDEGRVFWVNKNQCIYHIYRGYFFNSEIELRKVFDPKLYSSFHIEYDHTSYDEHHNPQIINYYKFELHKETVQQLLQMPHQIVPGYERKSHVAYRFENGGFLYLRKPFLRRGLWFGSEEHLNVFIEEYYTEEYPSSVGVVKKLWLNDNKLSTIQRISPELVPDYLDDHQGKLDDLPNLLDDTGKSYTTNVYRLSDHQVLLVWDTFTIILFKQESDFRELMEQYTWESYDQEIFFKQDKQSIFEAIIPNATQRIHEVLEIPLEELDYTQKSLKVLDKTVYSYYSTPGLQREILLPIIAYFGEVLIHDAKGKAHWEIRQRPQQGYWEPIIVSDKGNEYDFTISLIKDLENQEDSHPFCAECLYVALDLAEFFQVGE